LVCSVLNSARLEWDEIHARVHSSQYPVRKSHFSGPESSFEPVSLLKKHSIPQQATASGAANAALATGWTDRWQPERDPFQA
jgi:hypothetical protein